MTINLEAQTATVHRVKVGTRNLTQSMAKQLDIYNLSDIEVFGRLSDTFKRGKFDKNRYAIGRHRDSGALGLTTFVWPVSRIVFVDLYDQFSGDDRPEVCRYHHHYSGDSVRVPFDGRTITLIGKENDFRMTYCDTPQYGMKPKGECPLPNGWQPGAAAEFIADEVAMELEDIAAERALHRVPAESPLIVL